MKNSFRKLGQKLSVLLFLGVVMPGSLAFSADLDAHWALDNSTNDVSGNNHDSVNGGVTFSTTSKVGSYSASFNGTSDYLQYSDGTFLNKAISYFSYSFWVKPDSLTGIQTLLDEGGGTNGIAIRLNGNILENAVRKGGASSQVETSSFTFPNDGDWHHIAITYNNGDVIMYLDGVPSTTLSTGFGELKAHSSAHAFGKRSADDAFGSGNNEHYYNGLIDEITHYTGVLSQEEIDLLFHLIDIDEDSIVDYTDITTLYTSYDRVYNSYDRDEDGIPNHLDLDSDNDGIPDNVEAQTTDLYTAPNEDAGPGNNGLDSAYGGGLNPEHTDTDGIPDYLDSDSDDDDITDCEEGLPTSTVNKSCEIGVGPVEDNGLVDWAGGAADYSDVNGIVNTPLSDLQDILNDTDTEVDYRYFNTCGPSTVALKAFQWKIISFGCNTGNNSIATLLEDSLGDYGTSTGQHWVMSKQIAYTGNNTNDMERIENPDVETVTPGRGYWIITDRDRNLTVSLKATDGPITQTATEAKGNYTGVSGSAFDEVMYYDLPNSQADRKTKVMIGNPFHKKFQLSDKHYNTGHNGVTYYPMGDISNIGDYVEMTVYAHDSSDISSANDEYIAITPTTPGFDDTVEPMVGYFLLMKVDASEQSNSVVFPLEK